MNLRPVDMPLLRDEVAEYVLRLGPAIYEKAIREGYQNMKPLGPPTHAANMLVGAEIQRLKRSELFYVSADMTDLAMVAALALPEFSLAPEDLPSPSGLILFDKPIRVFDRIQWGDKEGLVAIVAACWSHFNPNDNHWPNGGIWVTWYSDREVSIADGLQRGFLSDAQASAWRASTPRIGIDNETQTPFSEAPLPVSIAGRDPVPQSEARGDKGLLDWMAILKTTWLLMAQPVGSVTDAVYDRAARRRIQREGKEPPRVRVITLRRPAGHTSGQSDREYHHQWIVRGHWRQQWYPAREVHRPVWIAPHIKGPEGMPLLGGERVYAWTR